MVRTRCRRLKADGDGEPAGTAAGSMVVESPGGDPCSSRRWWESYSGGGDGGDGGAGCTVMTLLHLHHHHFLHHPRHHRYLHHHRLTRLFHVRLADPVTKTKNYSLIIINENDGYLPTYQR